MNLYLINKLLSSPSELDIIEKQVKSSPGELKNKIKIKISSLGELEKQKRKSTSSLSELKNIIKIYQNRNKGNKRELIL